MTILGVDLSSNNGPFDFNLAYRQGCRAAYIKLGGDNIARYVSGSYASRVDQARAGGMIVGHYWVTGRHDPEAAAQFFVRNLRNVQPSDFFVLDNENLDDGNMYSDDEAARWIRTVQSMVGGAAKRVFMYASGSPLQGSSWAGVRATGAQALVAWYGRSPFGIPLPLGSWAAGQIGGHQYTSGGSLGGIAPVDLNAFADHAFDYTSTAGGASALIRTDDDEMLSKEATDWLEARIALSEQRNRRESRQARVYLRADGTLWIAGPTIVPRPVQSDTAERHDRDILKGDSLIVDAADFDRPQKISDAAWRLLIEEHDRFRGAIADAVVAKLASK